MSFKEKSIAAMTASLVLVFGAYFTLVWGRLAGSPAREVAYIGLLIPVVVVLVVLAILAHGVIAALAPSEAGVEDERDLVIGLRGDRVGGFVLATGVFAALMLSIAQAPTFWIAQALIATMVAAEVASGVTKLTRYRRDR